MNARFLLDEDVPRSCADRLRASGAFVVDLRDVAPRGRSDDDVVAFASASGLVLLTGHAGFGDLERFPYDGRPPMLIVGTRDPGVGVLGDAVLAAVRE